MPPPGAPDWPGAKLPRAKLPPPKLPPPRSPAAATGAVLRPIANATPPTATTAARTSTTLSQAADDLRLGIWTVGVLGTTGWVGNAAASGGAGAKGSGLAGRFGSKLTRISFSFVAQGADGIEAGGLSRRPDAEHDTDHEAEQDGHGRPWPG